LRSSTRLAKNVGITLEPVHEKYLKEIGEGVVRIGAGTKSAPLKPGVWLISLNNKKPTG